MRVFIFMASNSLSGGFEVIDETSKLIIAHCPCSEDAALITDLLNAIEANK